MPGFKYVLCSPPALTIRLIALRQAENVVYEVHRDFLGPKPVVGLRCAPFYLKGITSTEMDGFLEVADTRYV